MKPENKDNSNFDSIWNISIGAWNMVFKNIDPSRLTTNISLSVRSIKRLEIDSLTNLFDENQLFWHVTVRDINLKNKNIIVFLLNKFINPMWIPAVFLVKVLN